MDLPRPLPRALLRRVKLENYKSIATCSVTLAPLTVLVGRNGSGKSNFVDALRLLSQSLQLSLEHAIGERGGPGRICRRGPDRPRDFGIEVELALPNDTTVHYAFHIKVESKGRFSIDREKLEVVDARASRSSPFEARDAQAGTSEAHEGRAGRYQVVRGQVTAASVPNLPPASAGGLYLVTASGYPVFRPAFDALSSMGFYNLDPAGMKRPQSPDGGELLHRDGSNIASVIARLRTESPHQHQRIREYLSAIVPGCVDFGRQALGSLETVRFRKLTQRSGEPVTHTADEVSDGTLRALGILVAVSQRFGRDRIRLVGIEEPETGLHPATTATLVDALREASERTQIIVTTHSAELLEGLDIDHDELLVVQSRDGTTEIGRVDGASVKAVRGQLSSPGELLELDQLEPDESHLEEQRRMKLFEFSA